MTDDTSIKIVENYNIDGKNKVIIQAFTGSGLVASIVGHHLIDKLGMEEKGYISSQLIPSVGIVRNGVVSRPVRVYENNTYLMVLSEVGITREDLPEFIEALFIWYNSLDPVSIVLVGGLPTGRPSDAEDLKYRVIASDQMTQKYLVDKGIRTMKQGAVYGSVALSLMEAKRYGIACFAIMSHCIATVPDYLAAKKVIEIFKIVLNENITLEPLLENAIELREHLIRREKEKLDEDSDIEYEYEEDEEDFFQDIYDDDDDSDEDDEYSKFV